MCVCVCIYTRWFKYDRDICGLFTHNSVPVIFEPPCIYTGCNRRNVRDFGRVFLRSNYADITQNTYIQS